MKTKPTAKPDSWFAENARDLTAAAGLILIAAGLAAIHWALSAVVCGSLMLCGAVWGEHRSAKRARPPSKPPMKPHIIAMHGDAGEAMEVDDGR